MRLSDIKHLSIKNFKFNKELYVLLFNNDYDTNLNLIKKLYNDLMMLNRMIITHEYGNKNQVGYYIVNLVRDNIFDIITKLKIGEVGEVGEVEKIEEVGEVEKIEIKNKDDLFEVLIMKYLGIKINISVNISEYLNEIEIKNLEIIERLRTNLETFKTSISHTNIFHCIEILDSLFKPDKNKVLQNIIINLLYIHETESFDIINFEREINNLLEESSSFINDRFLFLLSTNELDHDVFRDQIFVNVNYVEYFFKLLSEIKTFPNCDRSKDSCNGNFKIDNKKVNTIYSNLLKLSDKICDNGDHELKRLFEEHFNLINEIFNK